MSDIIFTRKFTNLSTFSLLGCWAFDGE